MHEAMDPWLLEHLVCPTHREHLVVDGDTLRCPKGDTFPVVKGIPVMVVPGIRQTLWVADESLQHAEEYRSGKRPDPDAEAHGGGIDAEVQGLVASTCGYLYRPLINKLNRYPIPEMRLPAASGDALLDIGCGWGRWTVAAARKGYRAIGLDPSLRHVLAARRVCQQLGVRACFVVGDARHLPFAPETFDAAFSYSVIQHFSKPDARAAFQAIAGVLKRSGTCFIQMPNAFGVRSLYHQARRRFAEPQAFDVRYWTPAELAATFQEAVGETTLSVDGFFGLGIQKTDVDMLPPPYRLVVYASEALRHAAQKVPALTHLADSLYVSSKRR